MRAEAARVNSFLRVLFLGFLKCGFWARQVLNFEWMRKNRTIIVAMRSKYLHVKKKIVGRFTRNNWKTNWFLNEEKYVVFGGERKRACVAPAFFSNKRGDDFGGVLCYGDREINRLLQFCGSVVGIKDAELQLCHAAMASQKATASLSFFF